MFISFFNKSRCLLNLLCGKRERKKKTRKTQFRDATVYLYKTGSLEPVLPDPNVEPDLEPNRNRSYRSRIFWPKIRNYPIRFGTGSGSLTLTIIRSGLEPVPVLGGTGKCAPLWWATSCGNTKQLITQQTLEPKLPLVLSTSITLMPPLGLQARVTELSNKLNPIGF